MILIKPARMLYVNDDLDNGYQRYLFINDRVILTKDGVK